MSKSFYVLDWILVYWLLSGFTVTCLPSSILYYETLTYDVDEVIRMKRQTHTTSPLTINFTAFNRTFSADLFPSQAVFDPNVEFVFGDRRIDYDMSTFYHGKLRGEPHSTVKGHVINGLFDGFIKSHQHTYHVEKAHKYFENELRFHSVIYRSADVQIPDTAGCGASGVVLEKLKEIQAKARPTKENNIIYGKRNKRQVTVGDKKFCPMLIAADHLYLSNIGGGDMSTATSELVAVMSEVQTIFQSTDFDNDGTADGIVPLIARVEILDQSEPGYRFSSPNIDVNNYLDIWSQVNHEQFCLSLLLTYRDFANGVLGLAWVAQPPGGNRGGICERMVNLNVGPRFLNTAIVTLLNYGQRQPRGVTVITVAHEIGHNFGSPHDPSTQECAPEGVNGNFIMFPRATDGRLANNNDFSACSRRSILPVLQTKSNCFSANGTFCGNGVLEDGEQCDCGLDCDTDPCCDSMCMLTPGSLCSPSQSCCATNCQFRSNTHECQAETECGLQVLCTGSSAICSQPTAREGTILCNDGKNFCVEGVCSGSVCVNSGLTDCQCTTDGQKCHVCCVVADGTCQSSFNLGDMGIEGQNRESGRSCDNFAGYCDNQNPPVCTVVDNEDTLNDLLDIFTIDTLNEVVAWLTVYWYIPVAVVIGLIILIILLQLTYRKRKPLKRRFSQARRSLRRSGGVTEAQTGGVGGVASQNGRRRRQEAPRHITPREAINRLSHFFPNADRGVIQNVIQNTRSESKAVKKLLDRGYPMKRIPIPRA